MFALNLLGGAALEGPEGPVSGRAAHRRRLALLAILAVARGRPVGRERVIGLLWPDHRTDAARHLVSESLYVLRKELGEDALAAAGDEVGLNTAVVRCDVAEFDRAVEEGRLEEAARLYRGPFLDGFYVADAPEFERWAEGERDRLSRQLARALECLAGAAESAGRSPDAVEWWRRLAVHDPYNSRVGIQLMQALDAAGERASALWFAGTHVALLREELGVEPNGDFAALVERLRSEPVRVPPQPPRAPPPSSAHPDPDPNPDVPAAADDSPAPAVSEAPPVLALADARLSEPTGEEGAAPSVTPAVEESGTASPATLPVKPPAALLGAGIGASSAGSASAPAAPAADDPAGALDGGEAAGAGEAADRVEEAIPAGAEMAPPRVPEVRPSTGKGAGRGWRRGGAHLLARAAAVVGLVLGVGAAALLGARPSRSEANVPAGYDPRRVAVLYFDDNSAGGELGYLASGLTEMLIHTLSQVPALHVVSRNGVKPYRDHAVPFDSMVAELEVGSVVEGSVQRSGNRVRVTVQLIDAATGSPLVSRVVVAPLTGAFELEDRLVAEVSGLLRRRLGREIRLRESRAETESAEAWRLVWRAEQLRDDAARLRSTAEPLDAASADRLLLQADSVLARAEAKDSRWARPVVLRGWVAYQRSQLASAQEAALLEEAHRRAERVLSREPAQAAALELRGTLLLRRGVAARDSLEQARRVEGAERDLRAAVSADPSLATAWRTLSLALRYRGRLAESDLAARRALAEDAYLQADADILYRMAVNAMLLQEYAEARALCDRGHGAEPENWKFLECRLNLLRDDPSAPPDPAQAWTLLRELDRVDPPARAIAEDRAFSPPYRLAVTAGVLARAGAGDSARAVLARARRAAGGDPELHLSLGYEEAIMLALLGEREAAWARLAEVLARRPSLRAFASRDPLLRGLSTASGPVPRSTPGAGAPHRP